MTNTGQQFDANGFLISNLTEAEIQSNHEWLEALVEENERLKVELAEKKAGLEAAKALAASAMRERIQAESNAPYLKETRTVKAERIAGIRIN